MPSLGRRSPLGADDRAAVSWRAEGLSIREMPFSGKLLLRGEIDQYAAQRIAAVLGDALPSAPSVLQGADPRVLWLAPSRWLVLIAADKVAPLHAAIVAATAGTHVAV